MSQFIEFATNHWDLFLALAIILFMMFSGGLGSRLRGYKEVGPTESVQIINHEGALLLDVREDNEYKDGHILDSLHIPLGKLGERMDELEKFREKPIIVGCRSGHRSASACAKLRKRGFGKVYNLKGGVMAWQNADLPLQTQAKKKKRK
ncbi:MAG: rhodanese-like domain-containing protein [Gammaproteobacteria bacterium]|nr:rhodanese-like domain-containing protein [Gammaproteobacteria bacterium]MCW8971982.1 rhodanese-like domain-containing protein [Gammaproteobacteria bacterium]MCW8991978.1 rhodanese-like domain-containing protein [Gammaproteobacteria bacterium]